MTKPVKYKQCYGNRISFWRLMYTKECFILTISTLMFFLFPIHKQYLSEQQRMICISIFWNGFPFYAMMFMNLKHDIFYYLYQQTCEYNTILWYTVAFMWYTSFAMLAKAFYLFDLRGCLANAIYILQFPFLAAFICKIN